MIKGYIFKLKNCPSCEKAAPELERIQTIKGIAWNTIYLEDNLNPLAVQFNITHVPTIIIVKENIIYNFKFTSIMDYSAYNKIKGLPNSETFDTVEPPTGPVQAKGNFLPIVLVLGALFLIFKNK